MTIKIEPLSLSDVNLAAKLIETIFGAHADQARAEFMRQFKNETHPTYVFLAWQDDEPVAIGACLETYFSFDVYGICWVGVLNEHRKKGICRALFNHIENFIKVDLLQHKTGTIILTADKAITLYEKMGYTKQSHAVHDGSYLMTKIVN